MASLNLEQIDDLVAATLPKIVAERGEWKDISMDLQKYYFADRLFRNKAKRLEMGGTSCIWDLQVANPGNFGFTGLYAVDTSNDVNLLTQATDQWAMSKASYIYDVMVDAFQNGVPEIVRLLRVKEHALDNDFFAGMEAAVWTQPTSATQNPRPLNGFPYWLQKSATEGFNGGDPGVAWYAGNIPTATYPNWKNYTFAYAGVTRDDFVEKIMNAMDYCDYRAPAPYQELKGGKPSYEMFTVHSVISACRKLLQAGNDNIGTDLAAYGSGVSVRGAPMSWVPALDRAASPAYDSSNPIYGIDWNTFEYANKSGFAMSREAPFRVANQSTVRMRILRDTGQILCYDRRKNFVGYYSASAAVSAG